MRVSLGLNLEYSRRHDWSFRRAVEEAAGLGYEYVEPMVHLGRQLLSEGGYLHSLSMSEDPLWALEVCAANGLKVSALSSHAHLCKPDFAVEYLRQGIRWAGEMGVRVVNTSEGHKRPWTSRAEDMVLIGYSLKVALNDAERRGVMIGLEPHQQYSGSLEGLYELLDLTPSPWIGVNFDTGNAYLCGRSDIYAWMEHIRDRLVHVHAKDISAVQGKNERGRVSGTAVGCACGDGMIDWRRIIRICLDAPRDIVLSVECGSHEEAKRSHAHLSRILSELASPG